MKMSFRWVYPFYIEIQISIETCFIIRVFSESKWERFLYLREGPMDFYCPRFGPELARG